MANETNYPFTVAGLYRNEKSDRLVLSSIPLDQERADQICAMVQQCVGGKLEVREWGGKSKAGKDLPSHKLEGVTAEILAARKAYGETLNPGPKTKTQVVNKLAYPNDVNSQGDDAL